MKPSILIIPGYGGKPRDKMSLRFKRSLESKYDVYIFSPEWKKKSIKLWIKQTESFVKKNKLFNSLVFAHSLGAMIAVCAKIRPRKLLTASLSPYFKDDLPFLDKTDRNFFGKKMLKELGGLRVITKPNISFAGSLEADRVKKYANRIVDGAGHMPTGKYFKEIIKELMK